MVQKHGRAHMRRKLRMRARGALTAGGRPLNSDSKDFTVVSSEFVSSGSWTAEAVEQEDRLRDSNRPVMSARHSGPRVSRALTPRSLGSDFRSRVDLVPRAPV